MNRLLVCVAMACFAPLAAGIGSGEEANETSCSEYVPLLPTAAPPIPPGPCPGIRPGALMGNGCTMAFIFETVIDGDRDLYVSTAGHCAGVGWNATLPDGSEFGETLFSRVGGAGNDYALIRVFEERESEVNPALCHWGGPVRLYQFSSIPDRAEEVVLYYGNGVHTGGDPLQKPRAGIRFPADSASSVLGPAAFVGLASGGDSGSPAMLREGQAWAIIGAAVFVPGAPTPAVAVAGTPYGTALLFWGLELGLDLELVTAPLASPN